jgi:hypothetical protein
MNMVDTKAPLRLVVIDGESLDTPIPYRLIPIAELVRHDFGAVVDDPAGAIAHPHPRLDTHGQVCADCGIELVIASGLVDAVDWKSIEAHPRAEELEALCAACGFELGEHDVAPPHTLRRGDVDHGLECPGFRRMSRELAARIRGAK